MRPRARRRRRARPARRAGGARPRQETSTSTTIVATYGIAFVHSSVGPRLMLRACSSGASACSAPKKYAPTRHSSGRQNAKMTSAIAIQPAPPTSVSPLTHCGVIASVNVAPATPANAPPTSVCDVAIARDADPHRVGSARRLADGAHVQTGPRAREVVRDRNDADPREVDERRLPEHDRPDDRPVLHRRREDRVERVRRRRVRQVQVVAEIRREPDRAREDRQREPGDDLARAQRDHEERVDRRHHARR